MNNLELLKKKLLLTQKATPIQTPTQSIQSIPPQSPSKVVASIHQEDIKIEEAPIQREKIEEVVKQEQIDKNIDKLSFLKNKLKSLVKTAVLTQKEHIVKQQSSPLIQQHEKQPRESLKINSVSSIVAEKQEDNGYLRQPEVEAEPEYVVKSEDPQQQKIENSLQQNVNQQNLPLQIIKENQQNAQKAQIKHDLIHAENGQKQDDIIYEQIKENKVNIDLNNDDKVAVAQVQDTILVKQDIQKFDEIQVIVEQINISKGEQQINQEENKQKTQQNIIESNANPPPVTDKLKLFQENLKKLKSLKQLKQKQLAQNSSKLQSKNQLELNVHSQKINNPIKLIHQEQQIPIQNNQEKQQIQNEPVREDEPDQQGYESQIAEEDEEKQDVQAHQQQKNLNENDIEEEQLYQQEDQHQIQQQEQRKSQRDSKKVQKRKKIILKELNHILNATKYLKNILTTKYGETFVKTANRRNIKELIQVIQEKLR